MNDRLISVSEDKRCSLCGKTILYGEFRLYSDDDKETHLTCHIEYMAQLKAREEMNEHINKYHKG